MPAVIFLREVIKMQVKAESADRKLQLQLAGEIDHHAARFLREKIDKKMFEAHPEVLLLDFSEVKFMDSSGIGLILGRAQIALETGAAVQVTGLSPRLERLILLSGVEKMKNVSICRPAQ